MRAAAEEDGDDGREGVISRVASFILADSTPLLRLRTTQLTGRSRRKGDYVAQKNLNRPLAHWKLWHLRNGEYEVAENLAGPHARRSGLSLACPIRAQRLFAYDRLASC